MTVVPDIGVIAIGRNEGARLIACLDALAASQVVPVRIVYVDSGSTDGSVAAARARGAEVVELDTDIPFTAAR
uniref:glycosyltransferase family 2 protein n=1 Tax=Jannaschia sp. 2305UL9-9 TaxID=3121638 RepID=UPI0035294F5A